MRKLIVSALVAVGVAAAGGAAQASEGAHLQEQAWSWQGAFGRYDQAQLKRGFQVFHEVCSNCHSLNLVAYRNLSAVGLTEDEITAVAAEREKADVPNDEGQILMRAGKPSDRYIAPFPNEQAAAAANGGAAPPDLSLMAKARKGGPDYIYNLLLGFEETPPEGVTIPDGKFFNHIFPGNAISMPPQLMDDLVTYADGTKATKEQLGHDITAFLNWAAEPELDERKGMGLKVMIFLAVLTAMFYALKRQIWKDVH